MKKILFGLIATVFFGNITFGQIDILKLSKNPYNEIGETSFNFLIELSDLSQNEKSSKEDIENKIKNSVFSQKIVLNDLEQETIKLFFVNSSFNLNKVIDFENYIMNNNFTFKKDNILKLVSYLKWNMFFMENSLDYISEKRPKGQSFDACLDICMRNKLRAIENSNWVAQAGFILGQPEATAWLVAECAWDCR